MLLNFFVLTLSLMKARRCPVCGTTKTPLWRRCAPYEFACNKCTLRRRRGGGKKRAGLAATCLLWHATIMWLCGVTDVNCVETIYKRAGSPLVYTRETSLRLLAVCY